MKVAIIGSRNILIEDLSKYLPLAFERSTKDNPFVEKYIWKASNSARVCELCAARDGQEFNKGGIPLDHPNGMCVLIPKISKSYDEIADELARWVKGKENESLDKWLNSEGNGGIISAGRISGGRNPYGQKAKEHAEKYYGLVRSMKTDVAIISKVTGISEEIVQGIKDFVFNEKHDLGGAYPERFEPDYMMAESWQRLIDGKPKKHDIVLINHEQMEQQLMALGLSQDEAHIKTSEKYNYGKEANEFYGKIKKYSD